MNHIVRAKLGKGESRISEAVFRIEECGVISHEGKAERVIDIDSRQQKVLSPLGHADWALKGKRLVV
jgi:hypothetical protein